MSETGEYRIEATEGEEEYAILSLCPAAHFTQSYAYGEWQKAAGRIVKRYRILCGNEPFGFFQVIFYPLFGRYRHAYIPHGPVLKNNPREDFFKEFGVWARHLLKNEEGAFLRFDMCPPQENKLLERFFRPAPPSSYHAAHIQPKYEWILDLRKSEEDLLRDMQKNGRYSIRLAERNGVETIVSQDFLKHLGTFYLLMRETAERDKFSLHPKEYYERIFELSEKEHNAYLVFSFRKKGAAAINYIAISGTNALWVFGASRSGAQRLGAAYLAQWAGIKEAKKRGLASYSFGGIAPEGDALYKKWEGLSGFKKKFGGTLVEYGDLYDVVANPLWHSLYTMRKFLRRT